ncbi:B3 domain-containing protein [Quillaja saponaria]|uniref:B3 domain-containing protein n=1 Tax=Quillaja saponaria TaxID=32244 RepID=A0AAD7LUJ4_QUISA|nr:B3 domain-containing protein [Quillaja saponaria]
MGSENCMNELCAKTTTHQWKKGWPLRSGGFAHLCYKCGSAYERSVFCDIFHLHETGWRECTFCNKRIHCGCIASMSLFEHLDIRGIGCNSCVKDSQVHLIRNIGRPNGFGSSTNNSASDPHSTLVNSSQFTDSVDEGKLMQLCRIMEANESINQPQSQIDVVHASNGKLNQEVMHPIREPDTAFSSVTQPSVPQLTFSKLDNGVKRLEIKDKNESPAQPSLSMTLGAPSGMLPFSCGIVEGRDQGKASPPFHQGQRSRPILPKPVKTGLPMNSETSKGTFSQIRIARPPAEGRGKNQLLPRYWPRITDKELEQLSGDLNSTVVPLFEKVLSASDAGRIGRLVLPKACAEAYFPPISQSEGLPLKMQDVKGNEWTFQFRFWPNNNSRMYVLEGVTPCIQSMQLQAGDTVTFSRIDPGGKLMMGFRKASLSADTQDATTSASNGISSRETTSSSAIENLPAGNGCSDLLQSIKGSKEPHLNAPSEHLHVGNGDINLPITESNRGMTNSDTIQLPIPVSEKKRARNIGPKSKRLLIHNEDSLELRLTWEEAQDLLRPPPSAKPTIVTIEDHVFEEYDEPPVFGKRTVFTARPSGGQEQWAQCDDCSKWRRLPVDVLLPPKWTCSDNVWDASRSLCSVLEELGSKELENILRASKDFKKRRMIESSKSALEHEPSGLDALASAAVLGENDSGDPSAGATTKHPRHRPGCTCIVCIQPPSGKGKHKPTCTCNVCMTVKRRFKTLMLRKKKRQSEREADSSHKDDNHHRDEPDSNLASKDVSLLASHLENEGSLRIQTEVGEPSAGQIDLNAHPNREDMLLEVPGLSMMSDVEMPRHCIKQNGLKSLICEQQASLGSCLLLQTTGERERHLSGAGYIASVVWERKRRDDEVYRNSNADKNSLS